MMLIQGGQIIERTGVVGADVRVTEGVISEVAGCLSPAPGEPVVDATGHWMLPGAVDGHTHFGMPLRPGLSSLSWAESSAAAVLGGTTTVIDFANPEPGETLQSAVGRWHALAEGQTHCDYGLHVTVTDTGPERLGEIPALIAAGLPTFKGFLAYKGRLMLTLDQMKDLMVQVAACGGMLLVHAEDGEMNEQAAAVLQDTGRIGPNWHPLAHPAASELKAVAEVLALAEEAECPLTIVHISLVESAAALQDARARRGVTPRALIGEVCLHHLFADESLYEAGHEAALAAICSPPLRPASQGPKLLALLDRGELDILSTDHCEFCLRDKASAAAAGFAAVPNGCGGVGERLVVSHTEMVAGGRTSPARWQEVLCERPATLLGLGHRKGRIAAGHDADLVLFDPRPSYRWEPLGQSDRAGSIWAGKPVRGRVTDVWLRGTRIVRQGIMTDEQPGGVFLPRRLSPSA